MFSAFRKGCVRHRKAKPVGRQYWPYPVIDCRDEFKFDGDDQGDIGYERECIFHYVGPLKIAVTFVIKLTRHLVLRYCVVVKFGREVLTLFRREADAVIFRPCLYDAVEVVIGCHWFSPLSWLAFTLLL